MNALYRDELDELPEEHERERFRITDLPTLTWGMRKLAALKAKRDEVNELANAEVARIEAYRERELKAIHQSEDFFAGLIGEYAREKREEDPKFKRQVTPYGTVGFRKQQPKWHYNNEALLAFLKENGQTDLIRIIEEPEKTKIKKRFVVNEDGRVFDENGQQVEAIMVEILPDAIDIKPEV